MVLLMQARQGSSEIVVMVIQYLEQKRKDSSIKIDMQIFFEAVKMTKGWDRAATEKLIQRGRFLFKLANLRPEEVLCTNVHRANVHVVQRSVEEVSAEVDRHDEGRQIRDHSALY